MTARKELQSRADQQVDELDRVSQAYSDPGWWYNVRGVGVLTLAYRTTIWSQIGFLERNVGANHLEIPVGTGTLLKIVLRRRRRRSPPIKRIVAIDYSETMVRSASRCFDRRPDVEVRQGDVANIEHSDAEFDTINVANGFHCFPDPDGALKELYRVLKPGGTIATNVLLHPRGAAPLRWISSRVNEWGRRTGLLVDTFAPKDISDRFIATGFTLLEDRIIGNTVNILARKPASVHKDPDEDRQVLLA